MIISKKLKKTILVSILSVIFAATAFNQASSAVALITLSAGASDDFTVNNPSGYLPGDDSAEDLITGRLRAGKERDLSFIKFDISGFKNHNVVSAAVKLYGAGTESGTIGLYYVSDDDWVNELLERDYTEGISRISPVLIGQFDVSGDDSQYIINLTDFSQLQADINASGDMYFSVAIREITKNANADFNSSEAAQYNPSLSIEAPAPEPSSILLGLMGLGSMLGFKRKKA